MSRRSKPRDQQYWRQRINVLQAVKHRDEPAIEKQVLRALALAKRRLAAMARRVLRAGAAA